MRSRNRLVLALIIALATGCGNQSVPPEEAGSDAVAGEPQATMTTRPGVPEPPARFTSVELPTRFPGDFPIAPESTIIEARTRVLPDGSLSEVSIVAPGSPAEIFEWYRRALSAAGWMIVSEDPGGARPSLHATQGTSTVDLSSAPDPEAADRGYVRTRASIWKTET